MGHFIFCRPFAGHESVFNSKGVGKLLGDLKEMSGYWKLKEEALDRTCGELAVEDAMDLSYDRVGNE